MNINISLAKFNIANSPGSPPEHSPEFWQAWIAELPIMNIGRSAAVIRNAIQRITDNHPADPNTWLTILELLRPSVAVLRHSITENYLTVESLALNKKLVIAGLIQTLQFSLVEAYCQLAYSLIGVASQPHKELVAIASHRAINYLSEILLQIYQVYSVPPKGLWQKLHTLYQLAETIQMTDYFAIHEIGNETVTKISIKDAYQRALLIALANFYPLEQEDMQHIYHALTEWSVKTQLRKSPNDIHVIRSTRDEPPLYRRLLKETDIEEPWLSFDTACLMAYLERLINHPQQNPYQNISSKLLQHLIKSWGNIPARAFPRIKQNSHMKVCIGLSTVHYCIGALNKEFQLPATIQREPANSFCFTLSEVCKRTFKEEPPALMPGELNNQLPEPDVWEADFLLQQKADEALQADAANINPKYAVYSWKVIDSSQAGYALFSTTERTEALKVGELVGLQQQDPTLINNWYLGVVRWIRITAEGGLLVGTQLLTTSAIPICLQINKQTKPLPALFIPAGDAEQPQTIFTLNAAYDLNHPMLIQHRGKSYEIEFTRQVNKDSHFKSFEFDVVRCIEQ